MQICTHSTVVLLTDNVDFAKYAAHYRPLVVEINTYILESIPIAIPDGTYSILNKLCNAFYLYTWPASLLT